MVRPFLFLLNAAMVSLQSWRKFRLSISSTLSKSLAFIRLSL